MFPVERYMGFSAAIHKKKNMHKAFQQIALLFFFFSSVYNMKSKTLINHTVSLLGMKFLKLARFKEVFFGNIS